MLRTIPIPRIKNLPPPPPNRVGWPWTEESPPAPEAMADGSSWPRVSVVTPSYNQGQFIEETIRSVLLQGYPNLEYVIVDGGSTDDSIDIIRKYGRWLTYWVSEPDRGQSHAINKGWAQSSGDIWAWLNSDDLYLPTAIQRVVEALSHDPENAMVYSDGVWIDETSLLQKPLRSGPRNSKLLLTMGNGIPQPTVFLRRSAVQAVGGMDNSLHMAMDYDLWIKLALRYRLSYIEGPPLAKLRDHVLKKTSTRELEGLMCSLAVLERGFESPLCPLGITSRGNRAYAQICLLIARYYFLQNPKDYQRLFSYFLKAWKSQPTKTLVGLINEGTIGLYRRAIPKSIQQLVRSLRGNENQGWNKQEHNLSTREN